MTMTTNLMRSPVVLYYARFNKTRAGKEMSFFFYAEKEKSETTENRDSTQISFNLKSHFTEERERFLDLSERAGINCASTSPFARKCLNTHPHE